MTPESSAAQPVVSQRRPGRWFGALGCLLLVVAGLAGLFGSEGGLRLACRVIERLAGGQLSLGQPAGVLGGAFSLQSAHWRSATLDLQVQQVEVDWRPRELLRGRLAISRAAAASLRVSYVASSEPVVLPDSLELPLAIDVEQLHLGRIELADHAHPAGQPAILAEDLGAQLISDDGVHRLPDLHARVAGLAVTGEASLGAGKPFALAAKAGIEGEAAGRTLAFDLAAEGRLDEFTLQGAARPLAAAAGDRFLGEVTARIAPFAPQVIGEAVAQLSGVDPAAWLAGAPRAELDLRVDLRPLGDSASGLTGRLLVRNRRPGPVDRQLLPVESLAAGLTLDDQALHLSDFDLELSGGGRLRGSGTLCDSALALTLNASGLDAGVLYGGLQHTRLAGPVSARLGLHRQQLQVELRDPRFALAGKLAIDPESLAVEALRLAAGAAQLVASGQVALVGDRKFVLQGSLKDFDPSRFARLPTARLNVELDAQGSSLPQLAFGLRFRLRNSSLAGQPLTGGGELDLLGQRLRKADIELTAAGNRLSAKGAFGGPGERLTLSVAAPKLDPLGADGDLTGEFVLGGSVRTPELKATLHSSRLALRGFGQWRGLELQAQLAAGEQGVLNGRLRLAALDLPGGETAIRALQLEADGVRSRHRVQAKFALAGPRDVALLFEGGMAAPASGLTWVGSLREFSLASLSRKPQAFVSLAAPLPLQLASGSVNLGPAELAGAGWSARLERARYQAGGWQTAGSLRALPVAETLAEFPEWFGHLAGSLKVEGDPLRLNGEWDVTRAARVAGSPRSPLPTGKVRLWRASGDLSIDALPLGLQEGGVSLQARDGRIEGQLRLRGKRLGEVDGELSAASAADTLINRLAPWRGRLRLNSPDLAWAGALIGPGWQLGGLLTGEALLAGTPAQPRVNGEWRGSGLAVRSLDYGMRLERGTLLLQLASAADGDTRLVLKELVFESELQAMPRVLKLDPNLDVASLTGRPGRIEASGELRAGQVDGVLTVRAERLGLTQRPDQWTLLSGDAQLRLGARALDISGAFRLDAGYWELARAGTPQLSDDVVIRRAGSERVRSSLPERLLSVNLEANLGRNFHFRGSGVESRLVGAVKIRSEGSGLPRATGSIRTQDGRFDAYGQKLEIERGILNFQGLIDNPGLNIRAMRSNLPVEAGVEVTGTAKRPVVRLVSDPEVPDAEKLSWLVLGHGPEQQGGKDSTVLLAAAQTILGGQDGGPLKAVQRGLGIDEFGVSSGRIDGSGRPLSSRIASSSGFGVSDTTTDQIVSVGKRLSSTLLISYDQSLTNAGSVVKLTVNLSRNLALIGRAGSETGLDLLWNHRFGR